MSTCRKPIGTPRPPAPGWRPRKAEALAGTADLVAGWIARAIDAAPPGHVPLLMLSGPQGSGKSTALAAALAALPQPVAGFSLDDTYLPQAERFALAARVSPLLRTRGPPGTHDLPLLLDTVRALRVAGNGAGTPLPGFDKLADDRAPRSAWRIFRGRPAAIVIEGWLMGALADPAAPEAAPFNPVEAEDTSGAWRRAQEAALAGPYAALWDTADGFCHLAAPDFSCVTGWRLEQEAALWAARGAAMPPERAGWVTRFIQHYERITRRMMDGARRPGLVIRLDSARRVIGTPVP